MCEMGETMRHQQSVNANTQNELFLVFKILFPIMEFSYPEIGDSSFRCTL